MQRNRKFEHFFAVLWFFYFLILIIHPNVNVKFVIFNKCKIYDPLVRRYALSSGNLINYICGISGKLECYFACCIASSSSEFCLGDILKHLHFAIWLMRFFPLILQVNSANVTIVDWSIEPYSRTTERSRVACTWSSKLYYYIQW